ncbi:MAG: hypothetical protein PVJ27_09530 [Candidatus Brocadiaceae bacterium]|jgi:hypothetical protein
MAEENPQDAVEEQEAAEAAGGGIVKKLFQKKNGNQSGEGPAPSEGVAHVPATVLTVEYLDDGEGMDAILKDMDERLSKMEEQVSTMQHTQAQLIGAVNQQAKDIGKCVEAIGRRIDKLYRKVTGGEVTHQGPGSRPAAEQDEREPDRQMAAGAPGPPEGLAPEVAEDPEHQNAWRIARVLAADLEAYHEEAVKEGVLYGTFYKLLREPVEKARKTYEERVPAEIVENYDYFSRALDELIVRKRMELEDEGSL